MDEEVDDGVNLNHKIQIQGQRKKFIPMTNVQEAAAIESSQISSASELPTRKEMRLKAPKIPASVLPPTLAKNTGQNVIMSSSQPGSPVEII